jgi:PAS domain S-box-containing protein
VSGDRDGSGPADGDRTLFDAMPQLGWVADAAGGITYYNRRWYEYTGAAPEQMQGWGWQSVHDPEILPTVLERWRDAIAKGRPFEMSFPLRRHDGVFRWFATQATPIRDPEGRILHWIGTNTDIDEQKVAERALARLSDLALALSGATTVHEVADVIVERGMRDARADTCTLYALDDAGESLVLLAHRGVAAEVIEKIRRITRTEGNPRTFETLRSNEALWAETASEYAALFPALAHVAARGPRAKAFWSVPLVVEGRPVGLLGMGFYEEQRFTAHERTLVETIAKQCAQALLRAQRRDSETAARRWLTTTLQSIGDAVIATDTAGRVTFMNPVAEGLTGWTEADGRGRPLQDVFPIFSEETRRAVESPVVKVLREGTVVALANHTVLRSKSGREMPIDDSAAPIRDAEGTLFGVVLVFRDATSEKRAQVRRDFLARAGSALASSLDYRSTLATAAQFAVPQLADWCTVDIHEPDTDTHQQVALAHVDPKMMQWARELGEKYPPDPEAPTGVPAVIRTGKAELYTEIPRELLEAGAQDAEHLRIIRELKLESAMVVPLRGRDRTLGAMTFIYADSGRRYTGDDLAFAEEFARRAAMAIENARALKRAEDARAEERVLRREADVANRAKDEFLATVSHELRTPLNAMLGWTVTLRGRNPPAEVDRGLAIIERNARRQTRLIEDVLDVSRIISGKLTLDVGPTNIGAILDAALEAVTPAAEAKGVAFAVDVDASFTIIADSDRLQQVVWNLLVNAVKFTPKGGSVAVKASREGSDVRISVADSGEGIEPDVLPHIFEAFRQADASTTRRHGGLGLGLAIVKQLVTAHGGTVRAASEGEGRGAEFVVNLPARAVVPAVFDAPPAAELPAVSEAKAPPRLDGLSVLVVDDEEDARSIVEQVLSDQGATVTAAGSADEALRAFEATRPDVIVSDIGMPEMDGYALIRRVRSLPLSRGGRTPALALTAYAQKTDAQRAFAAGFQMHVPKPVEPAHLVTLVANLGGRSLE